MFLVEVRQVLDHLACGNEPNDGGDKRGRAGNIPAVGAFSGGARRADAVIAAADGSVFHGADGQFARVDDLQMLHAVFPAEPAHDARERADGGFINICHAEGGGVYLVARAHGADDRNARLLCGKHQPHFARDGVDGVDHVVILREIKLRFFSGQEKGLVCRHLTVGIDGADTGFRCVDLAFADGLARGKNLTVDVGQADPVVVDQVERASASTA